MFLIHNYVKSKYENVKIAPMYLSLVRTFNIYSEENILEITMVDFGRKLCFSGFLLVFLFLFVWIVLCSFQLAVVDNVWEDENSKKFNDHIETFVRISIRFITNNFSPESTNESSFGTHYSFIEELLMISFVSFIISPSKCLK